MKTDLLTGEEFIPKRTNQKFANPKNRITYHNLNATKLRQSIAHINKPLHNNLLILNEIMNNKDEATFHKQFLLGKGFSFGVHTHIQVYNGKNQYAIYHYIIISQTTEQIKIINND